MNKKKFKSKSIEMCQSALNFSRSLEEAETLVTEINDPANKNETEIKNSKLRKLKETFSKIVRFCEDALAESKELDRIPEKEDESIKRKTKLQVKNFSELNKKVKSLNDSLQGVDVLSTVSSNSKINFSEVLSNKLASFSTEFEELKEIVSDSVDSVEETAEKVNEMIEEDKAKTESPEIGNDSVETKETNKGSEEAMNFEEMKKELNETISEAEEKVSQIKDEKKKAEFSEKLEEIKEEKMDDADEVESKLMKLEKFSAEFAELENDAKEAACEKCGESPCKCEEIEEKDEELNETLDEMAESPKAANFARKIRSLRRMKCFSESDIEEKLEATEEISEDIKDFADESEDESVKEKDEKLNETIDEMIDNPKAANFSRVLKSIKAIKCFSEKDLEEKLEATEEVKENIDSNKAEGTEAKADVQKLAECVDKMEDILSEMNPSEELKKQFCGIDKAIQNFCGDPSKESKEAIDESVEEFKESAEKEVKSYFARKCFCKMAKCFAELNNAISKSNLPESSVDRLTPPSEVGGTDVKSSVDPDEIKKQNEEIEDLLVDAEKAVSKIKDPTVKNFASKRIKLISKMACFSEEDVEKKLDEAEELSEDIKETLNEEKAADETKEETKAEASEEKKDESTKSEKEVKEETKDDPSKSISDKEAANFSANKGKVPVWKALFSK